MKKYFAALLIALLALCGCSSDNSLPEVVNFNIPSEFHGTWESQEKTEAGQTEIIRITSDDIFESGVSIKDMMNILIDGNRKDAQEYGVSYSVTFSDESYKNRYEYSLIQYIGNAYVITQTMIFTLDNGVLNWSVTNTKPDDYTGELVTTSNSLKFNKI